VAAVLTSFHPDAGLLAVVDAVRPQVDEVVVVDNTPDGGVGAAELLGEQTQVRVLRPGHNLGLAAALNLGAAAVEDAQVLVLLDQDSVLAGDAVARLITHLGTPGVGVAAPAPWDEAEGRYLDPRAGARAIVADLATVITSGMVLRQETMAELGGFREDFFVDCVDLEFCLRMRESGYRVVQDRSVLLPHSLGATRWHRLGPWRVRATHHPTWRLVWVGYNSGVLLREHARRNPRWAATWTAILGYWTLSVLAFEPPRLARARALLGGLVRGLAGRAAPELP
jgi:rhamnosyltransferase